MRYWTITDGYWKPQETVNGIVSTPLTNDRLANDLIHKHRLRARKLRLESDYWVEDFGDEIRIYILDGRKSRCLINLQFEEED